MRENIIDTKTEKYRLQLQEQHETDVADELDDWISEQDEEPTQEAIEAKRQQLEDDLENWIDGEVESYRNELERYVENL